MKICTIKTLAAALFMAAALQNSAFAFPVQMPKSAREWKHAKRQNPFERRNAPQRAINQGDSQIGPVNSFGTLYAPDGTEWVYTAKYDFDENGMYTAAHLTIYDKDNNVLGTIDDVFEAEEHDTGVNSVQINPNVTQKFFNVNDKYELILFVHSTTDDYKGRFYQHIFELSLGQTTPLMTIPGNQVLMTDLATDPWSEKKQMVMMREDINDDYRVTLYYDVYDHAGWGSLNAPVLLHTFSLTQEQIGGSGEAAYSITMQNIGGKAHYALSYYEKPFFDPETPWTEEPVVIENNTFCIDVYSTDDFEHPYKSIRIPMETEDGCLYTFPCVGGMLGNDDFSVGLFDDTKDPYFIVTHENYLPASDDYIMSFHLYDQNGNHVKTIADGVTDYLQMADVPGEGIQFCLIDESATSFKFINLPSCEIVAEIPAIWDELPLSTTLDRVSANGGYNYVISCSNGISDEEDNVLHPIAYFNSDGSFNHWDLVNLGKDVVMAVPAIISNWLNPYLFDNDPDADYMFLVKVQAKGGKTEERFWILNANGEIHADFGPSEELGGALNTISVMNADTQTPVLCVVYYDWQTDNYVLNFKNLPLEKMQGSGTQSDPYLIATVGDLMQISKAPNAYYKLANDIDCEYYPVSGNVCEFSGVLDGNGYAIKNLNIIGCGLISNLVGSAEIKNLKLISPAMTPQADHAGLVASFATYDGNDAPVISNVMVADPQVNNSEYTGIFGTIIGELTTGSTVEACSVTDAEINLPNACVGGIVGEVNASGGNVNAVMFAGKLNAAIAGGIVGDVSSVTLTNAHVNANISGATCVGGVVGNMWEYGTNRGTFSNCFVEGTLTSTNASDASLGGIAGNVEAGENKCIMNNVVALSAITFESSAKATAHRIAGHTCADEPGEILWDDPWWTTFEGDPYEHRELWPRAAVKPDAGFNNNYALASLSPVNSKMANDATSVEGKSIEENELTQDFLASLGYMFGETAASPWVVGENGLSLWFAKDIVTGIHVVRPEYGPEFSLQGETFVAGGNIEIYTLSGVKVVSANGKLDISQLSSGIYVATCNGRSIKFVK